MPKLFLVWAGLWRKPLRTWLTVLSLSVGFLLFGLLQGLNVAFENGSSRTQADRLLISPRFDAPLPQAYLTQIQKIPGVKTVTWTSFLPSFYKDPKNRLMVISTEPATFLSVRDEYVIDPAQVQKLEKTRTGLIVLDTLAQKNGWKVGDQVALGSPVAREDGGSWTYDIVGIVSNPSNPGSIPFGLANYNFVNESRVAPKNTVTRFVVRVQDARRSLQVAESIDKAFESSAAPTQTQQENEFALSQLAAIGDLRSVTVAVMCAVFFATLLLTVNVIRQSARERTAEFGTLKAVGFSDTSVMITLATEALLLCLMAAIVGLALTEVSFPMIARQLPDLSGYLGTPRLASSVLALGLLAAVVLTVLSSALPAWNALRLPVVEALRRGS